MPYEAEPLRTQSSPEKVASISLDGTHAIAVPERLGRWIRIALARQKDVDKALEGMDFDLACRKIGGMNCHKVALFGRGDITFKHLTDISDDAAHNGFPEVTALVNAHQENWFFTPEDVDEFVERDGRRFPYSIHIVLQTTGQTEVHHSFLYLGIDAAGNKICFHKTGTYADNHFELTTLEKILGPYEATPSLYVVLPIEMQE